ncbi:MAG TPA: flavin reductase family protein [Alphaproteobacteria bacterium]|nr:flavin reductase family protein [Alphaproteobacteria bacterium]
MPRIEAADLTASQAYALLVGTVVPRPIAWVTSMGSGERINAAPFSCYTFVCNQPPMVAINCGRRRDGFKDTARNIRASREFVVNVVTEDLIGPMHQSSADYPEDISEPDLLAIELAPSHVVRPPRIAASPIALECRLQQIMELGVQRSELIIGEVVVFHISDDLLVGGRIDTRRFRPLARLGGPYYARLGEIITMPRVGNPGPPANAE